MSTKQRIAISTNDKLTISEHLGTCKYIALYDLNGNDVVNEKFIENNFTHVSGKKDSHGNFVEALQNCDVVISRGIGSGLEEGLKASGTDVNIVYDDGRLMFILLAYLQGQLSENKERVCLCHEK
jgi:predicted Fe-Mo cluster-binding NifX family protein